MFFENNSPQEIYELNKILKIKTALMVTTKDRKTNQKN